MVEVELTLEKPAVLGLETDIPMETSLELDVEYRGDGTIEDATLNDNKMVEVELTLEEPAVLGLEADIPGETSLELDAEYGGGEGASDYRALSHKPSIEDVTLNGNKELSEFGFGIVSNEKILSLFR